MYSVTVSHHLMVAHSLVGAVFGPAQRLHGATFVIDAAFLADTLDPHGIVIDIGRAHDALRETFHNCRFTNARLADEDRVILGTAREHLDDAANLLVAPDDWVKLTLRGEFDEVTAIALEGLVGGFGILRSYALAAADLA